LKAGGLIVSEQAVYSVFSSSSQGGQLLVDKRDSEHLDPVHEFGDRGQTVLGKNRIVGEPRLLFQGGKLYTASLVQVDREHGYQLDINRFDPDTGTSDNFNYVLPFEASSQPVLSWSQSGRDIYLLTWWQQGTEMHYEVQQLNTGEDSFC
jgi:hypothetical protein